MNAYGVNPWDALGDGTRRAILQYLMDGPRAVNELAQVLPVSRPAVSQHLRVLKDAGLVSDRAEGTRRVYSLNPEGLEALRADLDQFWTHALEAFRDAAEKAEKTRRRKSKEKKKR